MAKVKPSKLFPFLGDSLVHDPHWSMQGKLEWRPNFVFDAGLAFLSNSGGRSANNMHLLNVDTGGEYYMLMRDFVKATQLAIPSKMEVAGETRLVLSWIWTLHRGGNCYFVRPCDGES